ncbi:hypothetical protein ACFRAP_18765, partial [Peribacillus butanolivorans]
KRLYLIVKTKLIGTEGARLLREKRVQGRPHRSLPDRPRKASAWSGNNVRIFKTLKKTVDKLDFHRVCLQSEAETL